MGTEQARRTRGAPGQALVELAVAMLAVALVLAGLLAFSDCILASLGIQREARSEAGTSAFGSTGTGGGYSTVTRKKSVRVSGLAGEKIFGRSTATVGESIHMTPMKLDPGKRVEVE